MFLYARLLLLNVWNDERSAYVCTCECCMSIVRESCVLVCCAHLCKHVCLHCNQQQANTTNVQVLLGGQYQRGDWGWYSDSQKYSSACLHYQGCGFSQHLWRLHMRIDNFRDRVLLVRACVCTCHEICGTTCLSPCQVDVHGCCAHEINLPK